MSFGYGVSDFVTISTLATKVIKAYKDAPKEYKGVTEDLASLQVAINSAEKCFKINPLDDGDRLDSETVLRGCQSVLEELNSLSEKYKSLDSMNRRLVFRRVKLATEDIATLRARLTSNVALLSCFIQRFDIFTISVPIGYYANIISILVSKFSNS